MSFQLPDLSYDYDALEPYIDSKTMQIHHGKHHAGYTSKLNAAIEGTDLEGKSIEEILKTLDMSNSAVRNNGGGYYNHCLFWDIMSPNTGGLPTGDLEEAINKSFGSFEEFKSNVWSSEQLAKVSLDDDCKISTTDNEAPCTNINLEEFKSNIWNSEQLVKVCFDTD